MDNSEKNLTAEERRIKRIAQMRAKLQKEEALLNHDRRKKRNGQLIAGGVFMEQLYTSGTPEQKDSLKKKATEKLDERNRERVLACFDRLDAAQGEPGE